MTKKKFLAIFDLDGTLFDTTEVNYYAYLDALREYGFGIDKDFFTEQCSGRHYTEFLPKILGESTSLIEKVHALKKQLYASKLDKAKMNRHLFKMVELMSSIYNTAIVTTASQKNTLDILRHFECENIFDVLITQEDIKKPKPNPEGFLKTMAYFGVDKEKTIIFEDSDIGIEAARETGASVMVVDSFT